MKKWIVIGCIILFLAAILFSVRTEFVKNRVKDYVYNASMGMIKIGRIEGNLLFYTKVIDLQIGEIVGVDTLKLNYSPLSLLLRRVHNLEAGDIIVNTPKGGEKEFSFESPVDVDRFVIRRLTIAGAPRVDEVILSGVDGTVRRIKGGVSTTLHIEEGRIMDVRITQGDGLLTWKQGKFIIKDMWVSTEGSRLLVDSEFGDGPFYVDIRDSKIDLQEFEGILSADIAGILYGDIYLGRDESLSGNASLTVNDVSYNGYKIDSGNLYVTIDGDILDIVLNDIKTLGGEIDGTAKITQLPFRYESNMLLREVDISRAIGEIETSLSGEVSILGDLSGGKAELDISGRVADNQIESIRGRVDFGRELGIERLIVNDSLTISGRIAEEYMDISLLPQGFDISPFLPTSGLLNGEVKIIGNPLHPTLSGSFYVEDFRYKEFEVRYLSSNFIIEAFREMILGNIDFALAEAHYPSFKFDNLEGSIMFTDRTVFSVKGEGEGIELSLSGEMLDDNVFLDTIIYRSGGIELRNASRVELTLDLPAVLIEKCIMKSDGGYLECKGRYHPEAMDLVIIGEGVSLSSLWKDLKGRSSLWIELEGSLGSPSIELEQKIVEVFYSGVRIDTIDMAAQYSNEILRIKRCDIIIEDARAELKGHIPIALYPFSFPDEDMELVVNFRDLPAHLWRPLRRFFIMQGGRTDVDLLISGSPMSPDISGYINLQNISARIPMYGIALTELNSKIGFSKNSVDIDDFYAKSGRGDLSMEGYLKISSFSKDDIEMSLDIKGEDMKFKTPEVEGEVDFDISLGGNFGHPVIKGNIDVSEALAAVNISPRASMPPEQEFDIDLGFSCEHLWIKSPLPSAINPIPELQSPLLDMELAGEILAVKRGRDIFLTGEMNVRQGYFYYIDRPFEITQGSFIFDNIQGFDPQIDLNARSDIIYSVVREDETHLDTTTVYITLSGRASQLLFSMYSEPELPLEGIIIMLSLNAPLSEFDAVNVSDRLLGLLIRGTILADVERMLGVDALRFETAFFGEERRAKITAGKYLSQDLYASYTKDLFSPSWSFKTTYKVLKNLSIMGERTEEDEYGVGAEVELRY